jgi:putative transposase
MRYPASEKLEIIRLVEQSHLPVKQTLDKLGIPGTTFYRWFDRYQIGGPEALEDQSPRPSRVLNRISDDVRQRIVDLALDVRNCLPANWRCVSQIQKNILSKRLPSIVCLNPLIVTVR